MMFMETRQMDTYGSRHSTMFCSNNLALVVAELISQWGKVRLYQPQGLRSPFYMYYTCFVSSRKLPTISKPKQVHQAHNAASFLWSTCFTWHKYHQLAHFTTSGHNRTLGRSDTPPSRDEADHNNHTTPKARQNGALDWAEKDTGSPCASIPTGLRGSVVTHKTSAARGIALFSALSEVHVGTAERSQARLAATERQLPVPCPRRRDSAKE